MDVGAKTHLSVGPLRRGPERGASLAQVTSHPVGPRRPGETTARPGQRPQPDPDEPVAKSVAPLTPGRANPAYRGPEPDQGPDSDDPRPRVWVDQQLCTGDGFCAKIAPEQFRMHWDGLAYVVGANGELRTGPAQTVPVLPDQARAVIAAAVKCPGDCIYVLPGGDGTVYGQASPRQGPSNDA